MNGGGHFTDENGKVLVGFQPPPSHFNLQTLRKGADTHQTVSRHLNMDDHEDYKSEDDLDEQRELLEQI